MNIIETLLQPFVNTEDAWDNFKTGGANQANERMNEENIAMQERQNELNRQEQERINQANLNTQERINQANLQNQTDINNANIAMQRETNAQNMAIQQKQWEREDTNYQRTVEDMQKAGISPLAMSGLNTTGGALQMNAPQANASANFQAISQEASMGNAPKNRFSAIASGYADVASDIANKVMTAKTTKDEMILKNAEYEERKANAANNLIQAKANLAETIRHNKIMEKNYDWKNKLINTAMDKLIGKTAEGVSNITGEKNKEETSEAISEHPITGSLSAMYNIISGTATGNNEKVTNAVEGVKDAVQNNKGIFKKTGEFWDKTEEKFKKVKEKWDNFKKKWDK